MKIICIGRNYSEHARELNNAVPESPIIFMKPSTALLVNEKDFYYPDFTSDLHYEGEIVLKISRNGKAIEPEHAHKYYEEIAFGIDFTARDLQQKCKEKGLPWEIAKAFDHSAVLSPFISLSQVADPAAIEFQLNLNGQTVQHGNTRDMLFPFDQIIAYASRFFKLLQGDLIFTGTPAGVGPVKPGDLLEGFIFTANGSEQLLTCAVK